MRDPTRESLGEIAALAAAVRRAVLAELLTDGDAAAMLRVSRQRFAKLKKRAGFPRPIRLPGETRPKFKRAELARWIEARQPVRSDRTTVHED